MYEMAAFSGNGFVGDDKVMVWITKSNYQGEVLPFSVHPEMTLITNKTQIFCVVKSALRHNESTCLKLVIALAWKRWAVC